MRYASCLLIALLLFAAAPIEVRAEDELVTRGFDVAHLVNPRNHRRGPALGSLPPRIGRLEPASLPDDPGFLPAEVLIELLLTRVAPETWETVRGAAVDVYESRLTVRNRPEVVAEVEAWLAQMTAEAEARVEVALEVTEGDPVFPAIDPQRRVVDSGNLQLPPGVQRAMQSTTRRVYVVDYDVEIAQASNITDPTVLFPEDGMVADVRATPMLDGAHVLVEAVVQRGRYREPRRMSLGLDEECFNKPFRSEVRSRLGMIDLPILDHTTVHWTAVVENGGVVEVPVAWGPRQHTFQVRVQARGGGRTMAELAHLGLGTMPYRVGAPEGLEYGEYYAPYLHWRDTNERPPLMSAEQLADLIHQSEHPDYWDTRGYLTVLGGTRIVLPEDPAIRDSVLAFIAARERELVRPVVLELRVLSVTGEVATGPGAVAREEGARLLAAARLPTISGRRATVQTGSTANVLVDYDVEVAQEARISDPVIGQSMDGLVASLTPHVPSAGRSVRVDLELLVAQRTIDEAAPSLEAQFLGPLDRVLEHRSVVDTSLLVPRNGTYVLDLGPDPDVSDRRLVVEVGVTVP